MAIYNSLCMIDNTSHSRLDGCWEVSSRRDLSSMQSFKDPGSQQLVAPPSSRSTKAVQLAGGERESQEGTTAVSYLDLEVIAVTLLTFTGKPESHDPTWRWWARKCDLSVRALEIAAQQPHVVPGQFFFKITHKLGHFLPNMCKLYYTSQVRDLPLFYRHHLVLHWPYWCYTGFVLLVLFFVQVYFPSDFRPSHSYY